MSFLELGSSIKDRRKALRITQSDLAEMAGISVNTLYKIERGQANPTIRILNRLAELLGMTLWFSASAVVPTLKDDWNLSSTSAAWLTNSVQIGFVAGTILSAFFSNGL